LDADDYLFHDAVEVCLREFYADKDLVCVYTTYQNVHAEDGRVEPGYNWPVYSREKLSLSMIAHHFRMFTMRAWCQTDGFNELIDNAVDYDLFLKLSEVGPFKHVNRICYSRTVHGHNTSIKNAGKQKENHFRVVNEYLDRQQIRRFRYVPVNPEDEACRQFKILENG
jgi:chondroitin synthase